MSSATCGANAHPDASILDDTIESLIWWRRQSPGSPTSSIAGGGAVAAVETALSGLVSGRPVLALPSGTAALRLALRCAGVGPGDDVLVSGLDWPAARAAAVDLGARPVPVPVSERTLTVTAEDVRRAMTLTTTAAVVTHLHGVPAPVAAIKAALGPSVHVVEDACQAFGAQGVGISGDAAVFSLGPNKAVSAGELGLLVTSGPEAHRTAVGLSQHPTRQLLAGVAHPSADVVVNRAAPVSCILAAHRLAMWAARAEGLRAAEVPLRRVLAQRGVLVLDAEGPHASPGFVPVVLGAARATGESSVLRECRGSGAWIRNARQSGALPDPDLPPDVRGRLAHLASRVRILEVAA